MVLNETARAVFDERRDEHATRVFSYRGEPVVRLNNTAWQRARRGAAQQYEAELGRRCPANFPRVRRARSEAHLRAATALHRGLPRNTQAAVRAQERRHHDTLLGGGDRRTDRRHE